ncbi:MAG: lysophospholipase L1-like esterase [Schlesneria sp.]|nr:lysophospholipase L1-like esterase [Schlesneria sp.]
MDEPNIFLRWAMYHFAGGDAYLLGLTAFAAAQVALSRTSGKGRRWLIIGGRISLICAIADPSPIPWLVIAAFVLLLLIAIVGRFRKRQPAESTEAPSGGKGHSFRLALAGLAIVAVLCEIPYHFSPSLTSTVKTLAVVGDSVTAGLNDGEDTWPKQLARTSKVQVFDASQPGATLKSAGQQVELLNSQAAEVLILEIGGNDLLEGLPVADFERNLDRLLAETQKQQWQVVMFELPLPPLAARYCEVQRRVATRYQVPLIPRRQFLRVLTGDGCTVDGIHLSVRGQTRMMQLVRNLLNVGDPLNDGTGEYRHFEPPRPRRQ